MTTQIFPVTDGLILLHTHYLTNFAVPFHVLSVFIISKHFTKTLLVNVAAMSLTFTTLMRFDRSRGLFYGAVVGVYGWQT